MTDAVKKGCKKLAELPDTRRLLVLIERGNFGGVSAAGKLTGDNADGVVTVGSH